MIVGAGAEDEICVEREMVHPVGMALEDVGGGSGLGVPNDDGLVLGGGVDLTHLTHVTQEACPVREN